MEIFLFTELKEDNTFKVYRHFIDDIDCLNSVIIVDYKWTPWLRKEGNLLW